MVEDTGMPERWVARGGFPRRRPGVVFFEEVSPVGLVLALSLLDTGYRVLARRVDALCLSEFRAAGGQLVSSTGARPDSDWMLDCHEEPGVRTDMLTRLASPRFEHGRPRLELGRSARLLERHAGDRVATLVLRHGRDAHNAMRVALELTPRGIQLVVHGQRPLFEEALSLLTVLAERVVYAGTDTSPVPDDARDSRRHRDPHD